MMAVRGRRVGTVVGRGVRRLERLDLELIVHGALP